MRLQIRFELHIYVNKEERQDKSARKERKVMAPQPAVAGDGFFTLAHRQVDRLRTSLGHSTVENFLTALRSFRQYTGGELPIERFDGPLVKGYERWLREHGKCQNTVSCYMRSLRSLLTYINKVEVAPLFGQVFTGRAKTDKRAISAGDIARLRQARLRRGSFLSLTRDLFLFSFYALGMPFVDVAFLRRSQLCNGQLVYERRKTGQRVTVPLEPCMLDIISRYQRTDSDYVFPLIRSDDPATAYGEYLQVLNRYNRTLKRLAATTGVAARLTSYTARHSWASMAYDSNVELPVISQALGHSSPQHTMVYVRQLSDQRLGEANSRVLHRLETL